MKKLLVANRAEIARRIFRTARSMGIRTVAVYSDPDRHSPHVAEADEAVKLRGSSAADTYLDIGKIIAAAGATGADAVHPGYGFLSENAEFALACARANLAFVGPSAEVIRAMGSKIAAKQLMANAGVPVLAGGVVVDGYLPAEADYPVLIKAAHGGGGRGMRIARTPDEYPDAVATARREAQAAFGDGTVFVERYIVDPRHIEVQIFGDMHGRVIHIFERECSIQRRFQKIIEESPSPAVDAQLRHELCTAAVTAGEALGYVGAGTVEFVLDQAGNFFFLEVNTRLQVEHPVTELVTGLDLVELQLRVAAGEPLTVSPQLHGYAIEARLYAEDPLADFAPMSGRIDRIDIASSDDVRVDSGYEEGSIVSPFYDAMLAKVIATGDTREGAAHLLAATLASAQLHGPPTNRELLIGVLEHPEFLSGATDTGFLARHSPRSLCDVRHDALNAVAAALASQADRRNAAVVQRAVPSGWRNVSTGRRTVAYTDGVARFDVSYSFTRRGLDVQVNGQRLSDPEVETVDASAVVLTVDGVSRRYEVHFVEDVCYVDGPLAASRLTMIERLPDPGAALQTGSLLATLPGSVVRILVCPGEEVAAGEPLVILEAMKMEHTISSPIAGTVGAVLVAVGQQVEKGDSLAIVAPSVDG